jgi:hypothetical protein
VKGTYAEPIYAKNIGKTGSLPCPFKLKNLTTYCASAKHPVAPVA